MTIDEAIAYEKSKADKARESEALFLRDDLIWNAKEEHRLAEEHEKIAEWLEELKAYRENSNGYNNEDIEINRKAMYNKAIYDVMKLLNRKNATIQYSEQTDINEITIYNKDSRWIAEQLKAGESHENKYIGAI